MNENSSVLVSIVIPVFNAETFILDTLVCVAKQTFESFECIIVNDGSTDESSEIISKFIKEDSRFKCINIINSGCASVPRGVAIDNSIGSYVFNLDADDFIEPDCIEKMYNRVIETDSMIVLMRLIGCDLNKNRMWSIPIESFDFNQIITGKEACAKTILRWEINCAGMLVRRDLYENITIGNLMRSDELISRKLLLKAKKVAFSDTNYYYKVYEESISQKKSVKLFHSVIIDKEIEDLVILNYPENTDLIQQFKKKRFLSYYLFHKEMIVNRHMYSQDDYLKAKSILKSTLKSFDYWSAKNLLTRKYAVMGLGFYPVVWMAWSFYINFKYIKSKLI